MADLTFLPESMQPTQTTPDNNVYANRQLVQPVEDAVSDTESMLERRKYKQYRQKFQNKIDDVVQESIDLRFRQKHVPLD